MVFSLNDDVDLGVLLGKANHGTMAITHQISPIDFFKFRIQFFVTMFTPATEYWAPGFFVEGHEKHGRSAI